jgi:hypothetical protein
MEAFVHARADLVTVFPLLKRPMFQVVLVPSEHGWTKNHIVLPESCPNGVKVPLLVPVDIVIPTSPLQC